MVENILFQIKFLVFVFLLLCSAIFKELKDTGVKYRNRIRSRISNLKDLKNPNLRINVLLGIITPERLAVLTAEVCFMRFLFIRKLFLAFNKRKWQVMH
jgi:hypothetical protein